MGGDQGAGEHASGAPSWINDIANSPISHVLAGAEIGLFQVDMATGLATWDCVTSEILGRGTFEQSHPARLPIHEDDLADVSRRLDRISKGGGKKEVDLRIVRPSGEVRWVRSTARLAPGSKFQSGVVLGVLTDVTERRRQSVKLAEAERLSRAIIEASTDCMSLLDSNGTVLFVNKAVLAAYGVSDESELLGKPWGSKYPPRLAGRARAELERARTGSVGRLTVRGFSGHWFDVLISPIYNDAGHLTRMLVASRDVTEHKNAQDQAEWCAHHDPLTGLPNRALAQLIIDQEIATAGEDGPQLGLILLDADHLKRVNDGLGHDAGDAMLCEMARRLNAAVSAGTTVARLGGDEFAVIIPKLTSRAGLISMANLLISALDEPFNYAGRLIDCHASGGSTSIGPDCQTRVELMKNADIALYRAKQTRRGKVRTFEPTMRMSIQRRDKMLDLAADALRADSILAYYQPKVDLKTGKVAGLEALLRWHSDPTDVQGPDVIAASFEDARLAVSLSNRMIESVVRDILSWQEQCFEFGHVALNAAPAEFRAGDFADRLLKRLDAANIPPSLIQLEVTENVFVGRGAEHVQRALEDLSAAGVSIALDDFGTGYASLTHLRQFPVNIIKIDRSFVRDLGVTPDVTAIIGAVVSLATNLDMEIVAEGIETRDQEMALQQLGCHYGQGFLYAKGVPTNAVVNECARLNAASRTSAYTAPRWAA